MMNDFSCDTLNTPRWYKCGMSRRARLLVFAQMWNLFPSIEGVAHRHEINFQDEVLNFTFRKSNYRPDMASNCHHLSFWMLHWGVGFQPLSHFTIQRCSSSHTFPSSFYGCAVLSTPFLPAFLFSVRFLPLALVRYFDFSVFRYLRFLFPSFNWIPIRVESGIRHPTMREHLNKKRLWISSIN